MPNVVLIFSYNTIVDGKTNLFYDLSCVASNYYILIISHNSHKLEKAQEVYKDYDNIRYCNRSALKNALAGAPQFTYVVIGAIDYDFFLAVNNKFLCFKALWGNSLGDKIKKYGIPLKKIDHLPKILPLLINTSGWYRKLQIDSTTTVYSLMNARTHTNEYAVTEKNLINSFHDLLKEGNRHLFKALLYYLLGVINRDKDFKNIQDWGIFPSSGTNLNQEMYDFKELVRIMMRGQKQEPLFIRHISVKKSHTLGKENRLYCNRHFDSICLNPIYEGKLKNRNVCIFDDYLTNGTSFETARNLLQSQNVSKIICVSLGTFKNDYFRQDYSIDGNVFSSKYTYTLTKSRYLKDDSYNRQAMTDITNISKLFQNT